MNSHQVILVVTLASALGCGVVAGVLYAFSGFVMRALGRLPSSAGISAMQSINVAVINLWFLGVFLGPAMGCGVLIVHALSHRSPATAFLVAGAVLYLVGTVGVTFAFNLPRNERLAKVDPLSEEGERTWKDYLKSWTNWNHVRTATSLLAATALTLAFSQLKGAAQ